MVSISTRRARTPQQLTGQHYEKLARQYLQQAGLIFVAQNVHIQHKELDLIMRDQQTWVFVEVRYRYHQQFGGALATFTAKKRRHLKQAAQLWLLQQKMDPEACNWRFDVLAITDNDWQWITNAFSE